MRHVVWFSCGGPSFVTTQLVLKEHSDAKIFRIDPKAEHEDNERFIRDTERLLGITIEQFCSEKFNGPLDVVRKVRYINGPTGAPCTGMLKKAVRYRVQCPDDVQYFGYAADERERAERFMCMFPEINAKFPLIEKGITKAQTLGMLWQNGIELPMMYRLGYHNNNCIGCVKGGKGYWNKIRRDFPLRFEETAKVEREIGHSCINGTFLDELDPEAGNYRDMEINCDFVCTMATQDLTKAETDQTIISGEKGKR